MDPTALLQDTLAALLDAYDRSSDDAVSDAIEGLRDLADWLERGGFPPDVDQVLDELS